MATVSDLTLQIDVVNNGATLEANVVVEYDVDFSSYDQNSNQPYTEVCRLKGDDSGIVPAEDGTDDVIPNGQLFPLQLFPVPGQPLPLILFPQTASNGATSVHRVREKTLDLSNLNEDQVGAIRDEIRAEVTLSPVAPVAVTRESAQVVLDIA